MTEPIEPEADSALRRWGPWALFAGAIVVLCIGAWLRRHSLDDAFINYRIVHQLEAGNGPVFNIGERVEAFTSPLWLGLLTLADLVLPIRLEWIGMGGGILAGAIGLVFAGLGAHLLHRGDSEDGHPPLLIPLGAFVLAAFPPTYRLIATGLEDGLTLTWLGACTWALARWTRSDTRVGLATAALVGLGVLVRPDLAPFTVMFLGALLIGDRAAGWRRNTLMVAAAAALPVVSEILRMAYFGILTPNTAIAKSADLARWGYGWRYLTDTIVPYWFWIPLAALAIVGYVPLLTGWRDAPADHPRRRRALVAGAFGLGALICTLYIVRLGGDYMQTRLLLGAIVGFVAPVTFVAWPGLEHRLLRISSIGVAALWIIVAGLFVRTASDDRATLFESAHAVTLADFQATFPGPIAPRTRPGGVVYMYDPLPYPSARGRTPVVVQLGVGKVAYALANDVYVLDALGLANPIAAHEKLRVRGWPGHEKLMTQPWIAALSTAPGSAVRQSSFPRPTPIRSGTHLVVLPNQGEASGRPFPERVATARGVLGCARMERFVASYSAPLTMRQAMSNLVHSFSNQRLVVDGEPADAAAALCTAAERESLPDAATIGDGD